MNCTSKLAMAVTLAATLSSGLVLSTTEVSARNSTSKIAKLQGDWVATLQGNTGCGNQSMLVTFHLDANGSGAGTATITSHSTGCADSVTPNQSFNISSFNAVGSGVAGLTCGTGCGWTLQIQADKKEDIMALTDVSPGDAFNTPTGVAIRLR